MAPQPENSNVMSIMGIINQLSSAEVYEEFLNSCSEEQISAISSMLEAHANDFIAFMKAKQQKAQNEYADKVAAVFSDDPEMAKALSRLIKGDFDKSKVVAMGVQIILAEKPDEEKAEDEQEEMPPLEESSEDEQQEEAEQEENAGESQ